MTTQQPTIEDTFTIRAPTMDDLQVATELFNICSIADSGKPGFHPDEIRVEWQTPDFNLATDARLVFTPAGQLAGYIEVWAISAPHVRIHSWGRVHPDYQGRGIGSWLLQFAEARAQRAIAKAPADARVVILNGAFSTQSAAQALLRAKGYTLMRHFFNMRVDLNSAPPTPVIPAGLTIRPYVAGQDDARDVYRAVRKVFKDHWGFVDSPFEKGFQRWLHWFTTNPYYDPSLWFLALDGDQIAGISLCMTQITEDPDMGLVEQLGVLRPWRRQGLGLALLQHSFGEFYKRGKPRAGLEVDASSLTNALGLYEKAGMQSYRQYDSYEKELRAGKDLARQTLD